MKESKQFEEFKSESFDEEILLKFAEKIKSKNKSGTDSEH